MSYARITRRLGATAAAAVLLLAGCGDAAPTLSPTAELQQALQAVGDYRAVTTTMTLEVPDSVFAELEGEDAQTVAAFREAARTGKVTMVTVAGPGHTLSDDDPAAVKSLSGSIRVSSADGDWFELRTLDQQTYARADLAVLSELTGQDLAGLLQAQTVGSPPAVTQLVDAVVAGRWLTVEADTIRQATGEPHPQSFEGFQRRLLHAFLDAAEVRRSDEDTLVATVRAADLVIGVLKACGCGAEHGGLVNDLDGSIREELGTSTVDVDFDLTDGAVSRVHADFGPLLESLEPQAEQVLDGEPLAVTFQLDEGGRVTAPRDAVPVDWLLQMLGSGLEGA